MKKYVHAYEMLDDINKATGDEQLKLLSELGAKPPLNFLLSLNFKSNIKLDLPEGMPPLHPKELDAATHPDFIGILGTNIQRLKYCLPNSGLKKMKREDIFIQVLLSCPLKDAEIVCSAKDKHLTELYPNITADIVKKVFPSYVD